MLPCPLSISPIDPGYFDQAPHCATTIIRGLDLSRCFGNLTIPRNTRAQRRLHIVLGEEGVKLLHLFTMKE